MNNLELYAYSHDSFQTKFNLDILTKINSIETKLNNIEQKLNIFETKLNNNEEKINTFETKLNNNEEKINEINELKRKNNIFDKIININNYSIKQLNKSIDDIIKTIRANESKQELINECLINRIQKLNIKQNKNKILKIYFNKFLRKKRLNKKIQKTKLNISKIKKYLNNKL